MDKIDRDAVCSFILNSSDSNFYNTGQWRFKTDSLNVQQGYYEFRAVILGDNDSSWCNGSETLKLDKMHKKDMIADVLMDSVEMVSISIPFYRHFGISGIFYFHYDSQILRYSNFISRAPEDQFQVTCHDNKDMGTIILAMHFKKPYELSEMIGNLQFQILTTGQSKLSLVYYSEKSGVYTDTCNICIRANDNVPEFYALQQNYPNPFNHSTTIRYQLAHQETKFTEILIYNIKGQQVKSLVHQNQPGGYHAVIWDATDNYNHIVASGIYYYVLLSGDYAQRKKMLYLR